MAVSKNVSAKYTFDLGNTIQSIAEIETPYPHAIIDLLQSSKFNEAKKYFEQITDADLEYPYAITNTSNILEKYGRNLEAIYLYDEVLSKHSRFGMALCNKAKAIEYYIRQAPALSLRLVDIAHSLYSKGLEDPNLLSIGGPHAIKHFSERMYHLDEILKHYNYSTSTNEDRPKNLSKYLTYCLDNNLFLISCFQSTIRVLQFCTISIFLITFN